MSKKEKARQLLEKARTSPQNIRFEEVCKLAEYAGFFFARQEGSHKLYKHETTQSRMNFQPDKREKSKAKVYQVEQLVNAIDDHNLFDCYD